MKVVRPVEIISVLDVQCHACGSSTKLDTGTLQLAKLQARRGFGADHVHCTSANVAGKRPAELIFQSPREYKATMRIMNC
ncbi:hypothetical protein BVY11_25575 [Pseudomonas amygdali pv. morsprunorum]|nr:hypothetical protein BVY11_25575 [Pseudomonas amygdali pv. morsprunorum]